MALDVEEIGFDQHKVNLAIEKASQAINAERLGDRDIAVSLYE